MNCIGVDYIFSTTVLYEGFSGYNDVLKFPRNNINKLREIVNRYKNYSDNLTYIKEEAIYLREFIYKFNSNVSIEKIIYPLGNYDVISYEIIDLSKKNEKLISSMEEVKSDNEKLEVLLNNINVSNIKLRIKSRKNIWPKVTQIKIVKED